MAYDSYISVVKEHTKIMTNQYFVCSGLKGEKRRRVQEREREQEKARARLSDKIGCDGEIEKVKEPEKKVSAIISTQYSQSKSNWVKLTKENLKNYST